MLFYCHACTAIRPSLTLPHNCSNCLSPFVDEYKGKTCPVQIQASGCGRLIPDGVSLAELDKVWADSYKGFHPEVFPDRRHSSAKEEKCGICFAKFEERKLHKLQRCCHIFHSDCIQNWLNTHNSCPLCHISIIEIIIYKKSFLKENVSNVKLYPCRTSSLTKCVA